MICTDPCEKLKVEKLQLDDLSNFNKYLRLIKKYKNKTFTIDDVSIKIGVNSVTIYKNGEFHRDDGLAVTYNNDNKRWYKNGIKVSYLTTVT